MPFGGGVGISRKRKNVFFFPRKEIQMEIERVTYEKKKVIKT
jgi:hypothetical protein